MIHHEDDYAFEERAGILEYQSENENGEPFTREEAESKAILMELKRRKRDRSLSNAEGSHGVAGEPLTSGEETPA